MELIVSSRKHFFFLLFLILFSLSFVTAAFSPSLPASYTPENYANESVLQESTLPPNLQKLQQYQQQQAEQYLQTISLLIAFLAGALSLLSPCIVPLIPGFFAYTFKEKENIGTMTFIFFLGFSCVFVMFGIIASILGTSIGSLQFQYGWIAVLAGIILIFLGCMTFFGKGFSSFFKPQQEFKNDASGVFLFGMSFAAGWSACVGPVLAGVLLIASFFHNLFYAGLLLFSYSLGFFLPLFVLAVFSEKFKITQSTMLNRNLLIAGKKFHLLNVISGLLFIFLGIVFIVFKGTGILNDYDPIKLSQYFYSLQGTLVSMHFPVWAGNLLFAVLVILALTLFLLFFRHLKSKKKETKQNEKR